MEPKPYSTLSRKCLIRINPHPISKGKETAREIYAAKEVTSEVQRETALGQTEITGNGYFGIVIRKASISNTARGSS